MVAKVAGGILGLGLIGTGGVAFVKPEWLGINKEIPWTPLSADHDFSAKASEYANTNFGGKYKNYLVGVVGNQKDKHLNREMWEKLFKRWEEQKPSEGKFSSTAIKDAYSESAQNIETQKALNRVCEDAYKTATTNVGAGSGNNFKKDDVWKYCSPGALVTLTNESHGDDKIGSEASNKNILVSAKDNSNDWFWEQRNKDFWSESGDWSGSNATNETNKSIFKEAFEKRSDTNGNTSLRKTIKQLCGQAYGLPKDSQGNNNNTDAQKFCKLETN